MGRRWDGRGRAAGGVGVEGGKKRAGVGYIDATSPIVSSFGICQGVSWQHLKQP